jgi:hypothetical protein
MIVTLYDEIVETLNYFLHVLFSHCNWPFPSSASNNRKCVRAHRLTGGVTGSHCLGYVECCTWLSEQRRGLMLTWNRKRNCENAKTFGRTVIPTS